MPSHYLRYYWSDNAGLLRAKIQSEGTIESGSIGLAPAEQAQCYTHRSLAPESGISPIGDLTLRPDARTYTRVPYLKNTYKVFGHIYEGDRPWLLCPRNYLESAVREAATLGFEVKAAFEPEFYLLTSGPGVNPRDEGMYCEPGYLDELEGWTDFTLNALEEQNVHPECFHHEAGPGQYEISIKHSDPVKAADDFLVLRETVRATAKRSGHAATFCPMPFPGQPGSGLHLNISLWRNERSCIPSTENGALISSESQQFIAGILNSFDSALALTAPSANSHKRLHPDNWAGASAHWGYCDRTAAIRIPRKGKCVTHIEYRALDSTANPYIALGALIYLGLDGVRKKLPQIPPSHPVKELPTFTESMNALRKDDLLAKTMGKEFLQAYQAVRISDYQNSTSLSDADHFRMFTLRF